MAEQSTWWHGHHASVQDENGAWWTFDHGLNDWVEVDPAPPEHQGKVILTGEDYMQALHAQSGMQPAASAHLPGWEPTIPDRPAEPPAMTQEEKEQLDPWEPSAESAPCSAYGRQLKKPANELWEDKNPNTLKYVAAFRKMLNYERVRPRKIWTLHSERVSVTQSWRGCSKIWINST